MPSLIKRLSSDKSMAPRESVADPSPSQPPEPQVNSWILDPSDLPPKPGDGQAVSEGASSGIRQAEVTQRHVSPSRNPHGFGSSPSRTPTRSRMMPPSLSLPVKTGRSRGAPRIRYNRTPVRFTVCGEWALKECEEHTTWANELLKYDNPKDKSVPIVDLRKSIGDGTTLVTLTEKVYGSTVPGVQEEITCKGDRTANISHCLTFLEARGVDLAGIDAEDLADGNLKSALLLVGNLRSHLDQGKSESQPSRQDVHKGQADITQRLDMPGTVTKHPGAHSNGTTVRRTFITSAEDLLPGSLSTNHERQGMHETIISMTELGSNGVSQHGMDGRHDHSPNARRSRPLSAGASRPVGTPTPKPNIQPVPGTVSNAWTTESQKSKAVDQSSLSVEDRLKSLISSPSSNSTRDLHHVSLAQGTVAWWFEL
ncbi:neuron navigator 3-like [Argopecten irradians]|uniref:neuron navigator 3-like n=1 Tax=Argopecten irradians TaxID=31199 RepID=UPI00371A5F9D